jgi:hypothetical protein
MDARSRSPRALIALVVVAVLLLGVGTYAAFATGIVGRSTSAASETGTTSGRLAVDGAAGFAPQSSTPKLAWQVSATGLGYADARLDVLVRTASTWVVAVLADADAGTDAVIGLSASTGATMWKTSADGLDCGSAVIGDALVCVDEPTGFGQGAAATAIELERIDLATGAISRGPTAAQLGVAGDDLGVSAWSIGTVPLLMIADLGSGAGEETPGTTETVARLASDGGSIMWTTPATECGGGGDAWPTVARDQDGILLYSDSDVHFVLDAGTGRSLADSGCGTPDLYGAGGVIGATEASADAPAIPPVTHLVSPEALGAIGTTVDFSSSAQTPPEPIAVSTTRAGVDSISALSADGSTQVWAHPVVMHGSSLDTNVYGAATSGHLVFVDTGGHVVSVDPTTGVVQWSATYAAVHDTSEGADYVPPRVEYDGGGNVLVTDADPSTDTTTTSAFDARTGVARSVPFGWSRPFFDDGPPEHGAAEVEQGNDGSTIGALTDAAPTTTDAPSDAPACPAGSAPISWTAVDSGHVLLCRDGSSYRSVVALPAVDSACTSLAFSGDGYTLACGDTRIVVAGEGSLLQVGRRGHDASAMTASESWTSGGTVSTAFGTHSTRLGTGCATGAGMLAATTWHGGWMLVCGTDADTPTALALSEHESVRRATSVQFDGTRYCAGLSGDDTVCVGGAPAVVSVAHAGGSTTQHLASASFSAESGITTPGTGTGAYDVPAPADTASAEVHYLDTIIRRSGADRTQAEQLVSDIAGCTRNRLDTTTAASLVANRRQLIAAVTNAPVDKVPGGARLTSELTAALTASLRADTMYQNAVRSINAGSGAPDCDAVVYAMADDEALEPQIGMLKRAFVDDWNGTIAGRYRSAATFTAAQI